MTETNKARDLMATLRDALHQLDFNLDHTRAGVDAITSQVARLRERRHRRAGRPAAA